LGGLPAVSTIAHLPCWELTWREFFRYADAGIRPRLETAAFEHIVSMSPCLSLMEIDVNLDYKISIII